MRLTGRRPGREYRGAAAVVAALACVASVAAAGEPDGARTGTISGTVAVQPPRFTTETVVYIVEAPGVVHAPRTQRLDQKGMRFIPHVLLITVGDTVDFLNHDVVDHDVFSPDNEGYNIGVFPRGEHRSYVFRKPGAYTQLCDLHPAMLGYIYVAPTPWAAVVDGAGRFTIPRVPPGSYRVAVWNSHGAATEQVIQVAAGKTVRVAFALASK